MKKLFTVIAVLSLIFVAPAFAGTNVSFMWDPNPEPDIAGYRIYQSNISGGYVQGSFALEIPCGGNDAACSQGTLPDISDGTYFWVVTAFDTSGFESDWSNEVTTSLDTTPPAPPQNLSIWQKIIAWLRNVFTRNETKVLRFG